MTSEALKKYVRAADYITAAQLYLRDNFLLEEPLKAEHIKPRLLGHWGTCPGVNFVYANLNQLIKRHQLDMLFVLGPGHGFPALQANLFIENTLRKYYPAATQDASGLGYIIKNFSWPYGFPSHSNPGAPGAILEGGELGYSLATAYGSVLDNPDLITAVLIGDGEAETGPLAAAWPIGKLINPAGDGAVLPILHLNGYKISGPTILGRMSNRELKALFTGHGYAPIIVEGRNVYEAMPVALEKSLQIIQEIQGQAREEGGETRKAGRNSGVAISAPGWPMLILKTPKGWGGIKKLGTNKIEGNYLAHQIVAPDVKTDKRQLKALEKWLRSYKFNELFNPHSGFDAAINEVLPEPAHRMGDNQHAFGTHTKELVLPPAEEFSEPAEPVGVIGSSSMRRAGAFLNAVFKLNVGNKNFRLFSPDETYSNKLDEVFQTTARAWNLPIKEWDKDLRRDGRVMEILSEHSLQGLIQGYILTGRHGIFASYEAFIQIVSSMADQYAKFIKVARETPWRQPVPALNYILTSSGWRQEHNGFSHQNPGFIDDLLQRHADFVHVYFPPDGNSTLAVLRRCLQTKNSINVIAAGKTLEPRWLTPAQAEQNLDQGMMIWDFASDADPEVVLAAAGDYLTKEALAAISIAKAEIPTARLRFVNILELRTKLPTNFNDYFTADKPIIFNFHGYPETLKQILFDRPDTERFSIHGYIENGSTTTPFDMQVRNQTDRWHLAKEVFAYLLDQGKITSDRERELQNKYEQKLTEHQVYIKQTGVDPDEITEWKWSK